MPLQVSQVDRVQAEVQEMDSGDCTADELEGDRGCDDCEINHLIMLHSTSRML